MNESLWRLACGPLSDVISYDGYVVNGFRFRTIKSEQFRKTQNSGIVANGGVDDGSIGYYGVLTDIIELHYLGQNYVVLFKCDWWDVINRGTGYKVDNYGFISVNTAKRLPTQDQDPFILASQAEQIFYASDNNDNGWKFIVRTPPRDYYDMGNADTGVVQDDLEPYQNDNSSTLSDPVCVRDNLEVDNVNWTTNNDMIIVDATNDRNQMTEDKEDCEKTSQSSSKSN